MHRPRHVHSQRAGEGVGLIFAFPGLNSRRATWIAFLVVLLLDVAIAALVVQQIFRFQALPFDLDEANHANGGLAIFLGWEAEGLPGFVRAFFRQDFYPPGFAWIQAIAFDLFGTSITVARLLSAISFFLAIPVLFFLCLQIDRERGYVAGVVTACLTLTAQPLLINAALVMKEAPGLLVTFLWLVAYVRALKRPTRRRLALASFLLTLTFLMKYTYAVTAVVTVLVMEVSLLIDGEPALAVRPRVTRYGRLRNLLERRWLWLFGPFALLVLVWFARPRNVAGFVAYATAQPANGTWLTVDSLLFYPRAIARDYLPTPLFGLLTLAGLIWGAVRWRQRMVRLLLITFLVGMSVMLVNMPKDERFIATFVPAAHVLTGLMLGAFLAWYLARRRHLPATVGLIAVAALILLSVPAAGRRLAAYPQRLRVAYETGPRLVSLADWLEEQIPAGEPYILVNYWDQFGPQTMSWHRGTQPQWQERRPLFSEVSVPGLLIEPVSPQAIAATRQKITQSGACYLVLFEGAPWGEPFWPEYTDAMEDMLIYITEDRFEFIRPVAPGETETYEVKAIIYRLEKQCGYRRSHIN